MKQFKMKHIAIPEEQHYEIKYYAKKLDMNMGDFICSLWRKSKATFVPSIERIIKEESDVNELILKAKSMG